MYWNKDGRFNLWTGIFFLFKQEFQHFTCPRSLLTGILSVAPGIRLNQAAGVPVVTGFCPVCNMARSGHRPIPQSRKLAQSDCDESDAAWFLPNTWAQWCKWCVGGKVGPQKRISIHYSSSGPAVLTCCQISISVLIKHGQMFVARRSVSKHFHFSPLTAVFPWTSFWINIRHRATEPRALTAAWQHRRPFQLQPDAHICVTWPLPPPHFWILPDWQGQHDSPAPTSHTPMTPPQSQ